MRITAEQIFEKGTKINKDKTMFLVKTLTEYIKKANQNDIMPNKKDVSALLGISIGTVQNAYRILEDRGLVQSKQKIGTIITNEKFNKQTSKRDYCIKLIKNYMQEKNIKELKNLKSARSISKQIKIPLNTVLSALECIKAGSKGVQKKETLAEKIEHEISKEILNNYKVGDTLPSLNELSKKYKVSIKTIHDAIKQLSKKDIILPHRGRYGTVIINMPDKKNKHKKEDYIFAKAEDTEFYFYEKIQNKIKKIITQNYEIGSKLPSIRELADIFSVNTNTIRRALKYMEEDGYVTFTRGRYGGTFVTNIPEEESYKWLAVNPQYIAEYN